MKLALLLASCLLLVTPGLAQTDDKAKLDVNADAQSDEAPKTIVDAINVTWKDEQKDFIALADAMPDAKWNFKPTRGEFKNVRTFGEMVKHVACANEAFAKEMRGATPPEACDKGGPNPAKNKAEVTKYLRDSFLMLDEQMNLIDEKTEMQPVDGPYGGPNTRIGMAVLAAWHVADHYGQLVEYLRMNGIAPPASRPTSTVGK
jgi:DinB superfamily